MSANLQYATEVVEQLSPADRLQLMAKMAISLQHELDLVETAGSFWHSVDPETIAAKQNFRRPVEIRPLEGFDDDVDDFIATIRSWRKEDLQQDA